MHLFWGGRLAQSDFLYEHQLREWLADQRLSGLHTAFSRCPEPAYVQDKVREERVLILALLASQAQILVCGGRRMAGDVSVVLDEMLAGQNLSVAMLKKAGRYIEDTY
jgi:sulfite reductase (NADPH) flavoprotein alpha-component